jgi:tetratricopeptide (TPR) repeat protein
MRLSFSLLLLSVPIAAQPQGRITVEYPLEGSLFPPDFAPPTFLFKDSVSSNTAWRAEVRFAQGAPMRLDVHTRSAYGGMLAETGGTEKALVHLRIALEWTTASPDALNNYAGALARACRFRDSLPYFRKAPELEPGFAICTSTLAAPSPPHAAPPPALRKGDHALAARLEQKAKQFER